MGRGGGQVTGLVVVGLGVPYRTDVVGGFVIDGGTRAKALTGVDDQSRFCVSAYLMTRETSCRRSPRTDPATIDRAASRPKASSSVVVRE